MADRMMGLFTYVGVGVVIGGLVGLILAVAGDPPTIVTGIVVGVAASIVGALSARMRAGQGGHDTQR